VARYYASRRPPAPSPLASGGGDVERGRAIATRGLPDKLVPPCADCHGPSPQAHNPNYPALAGQYAPYIAQQLNLFKREHRGGTAYRDIMRRVAAGLEDEQIRAVAAYYASLPWAPGERAAAARADANQPPPDPRSSGQ
jgi:cytochrome c553